MLLFFFIFEYQINIEIEVKTGFYRFLENIVIDRRDSR